MYSRVTLQFLIKFSIYYNLGYFLFIVGKQDYT